MNKRAWRFGAICAATGAILATGGGNIGCTTDDSADTNDASTGTDASTDTTTNGDVVTTTDGGPDSADASETSTACLSHPPAGFSAVVTGQQSQPLIGVHASMALDENDNPMFAYIDFGANPPTTETLWFIRWDACAAAWTTPMQVDADSLGPVDTNGNVREVSLAYDPTSKEIAIGYQKILPTVPNDTPTIWLASKKSTDTAFATQRVSPIVGQDVTTATAVSVALWDGKIAMAYDQSNYMCCPPPPEGCGTCAGLWLLESADGADAGPGPGDAGDGGPTAGPHSFTYGIVPFVEDGGVGAMQTRADGFSVAYDSAGNVGLAMHRPPPTAYNTELYFFRPGMSTPVKVTDTANNQNDSVDVTLRFDGVKPRVAGHLIADNLNTYDLTFVAATNDGTTWGAPVRLPTDHSSRTAFTSSLAVSAVGKFAVASDFNSGNGDSTGDNPYVARSDDGTTWTAAGEDTAKTQGYDAYSVNAAFGVKSLATKLIVGFHSQNVDGTNLPGIYMWRE